MDSKRFVILGANGQVGKALQKQFPEAMAVDREELDITNEQSIANFDWSKVDVIINAAAYTNVDGAETDRESAWKVNASAVSALVKVANTHKLTLVHFGSDYDFDGTKASHQEDEPLAPLGEYATSKAAGYVAAITTPKHYVLRVCWVIGDGKNFVRTMKSLAEKGVKPKVVNDQTGRLTFAEDIAAAVKHLLDTKATYGTYNVSNEGNVVSWADIAREVYRLTGHKPSDVSDTTTAEYFAGKPDIAPRPLQSELNLTKIKATGFTPRDWRVALQDYLANEKEFST